MKLASILLLALTLVVGAAAFHPAQAQTTAPPQYSLLDFQHRLSVGGRLYRSFDELPGVAGSYSSNWWAGIPLGYIITPRVNANGSLNPLPISLIGALDIGVDGTVAKHLRGYVGATVLFKGVGQGWD